MTVSRIVSVVSALALVALIAGILLQRPAAGYHTLTFVLADGVPATLHYQDPPGTPPGGIPPIFLEVPHGQFRAGIVVAHGGFSADRNVMEGFAESLARAGYVTLSLDLSGHGLNRHPFSTAENDSILREVAAGVRYLQQHTWIEPAKIAVLGHSMSAGVALDYGVQEAGVGGLVILSGGSVRAGPKRPPNTLFLYGEHDFPLVEPLEKRLASRLAQVDAIENGKTYGDFAAGTAVRMVRIPGAAHGSMLTSPVAFAESVSWLDRVTGYPARATPPALIEHPIGSPLLWISFVLVLPGLGLLLGRLAPEWPAGGFQARWRDLGLFPVALLLPLPFLAAGRAGLLMGMSAADANVTHLALAGVLLVISLVVLGRFRVAFVRLPVVLALAAVGWLAVRMLLGPVAAYIHGVGLTPEKALLTFLSALCLAPFALATQWLVYRSQWWRGTLLRIAARIVVILCVGAGIAVGGFDTASIMALFPLIVALVIVEPVLAGFYGRSRNVLVAAGFDALATGWLFAVLLPTTV
jgi:dienelactone hydrolase